MENTTEKKKVILSCIQPTGTPTLGNYLGALKNWKALEEDFYSYFAVADLHAITVKQEPKELRERILRTYALLMAIGLDPEKSTLFIQSHVPEHSQLAWLLSCSTQFGSSRILTKELVLASDLLIFFSGFARLITLAPCFPM